jgi:pimeloyl-ACP methyl ester carboxylesterase
MKTMLLAFLGLVASVAGSPAVAQQSAVSAPTRYVDVGDSKIAYRTVGSGAPMILVNRMRGTLDTWDPLFLDELAKSNRIITVDYPGIGYSTGTLPSDLGKAVEFVAGFSAAIKVDRFVLLGWSWGGFVAQGFVLTHPARATHAILVGTNPVGPNDVPIQQAFLDRAFKAVNDAADEEVLFFDPTSPASRKAAKASHERIYARPGVAEKIPSKQEEIQAYLHTAASFRDEATRQKLLASRTPMLVLCGDKDISTPVENWFPLNAKLPNAHLVVYPESGHAPQHQYPELAATHVAMFLRYSVR